MITEQERKQAIEDTKAIWWELKRTGKAKSREVIQQLYREGKVSRPEYANDCPLCGLWWDAWGIVCSGCPWPETRGALRMARCETAEHSPYRRYRNLVLCHYDRPNKYGPSFSKCAEYAGAVYDLVKTFE